jgi:poly(hydroxyalkanoate) depolymerase family esterase
MTGARGVPCAAPMKSRFVYALLALLVLAAAGGGCLADAPPDSLPASVDGGSTPGTGTSGADAGHLGSPDAGAGVDSGTLDAARDTGGPAYDGGVGTGDGGVGTGDGGSVNRVAAPCAVTSGSFGGLTMYECVPSGMHGHAGPAPLVIAMHGYKQGAIQEPASGQPTTPKWGFISTTQWAVLAETYRFYVVFPDTGVGAPSFDWYQSFSRHRGDAQAEGIVSMVKAMKQTHDIDPNRVFVNGLSSGAFMSVVMLAEYPDVFAGGASFAGGAYGCDQNCAALGKAGWTWPGNHAASLVTAAYPTVWNDPSARKPKLLVFQGAADGAVTVDNMRDLVQQWAGALHVSSTPANAALGIPTQLKGSEYAVYANGNNVVLATLLMPGIGHGTPTDTGMAADQGGWDPIPSQTMVNDAIAVQDWTNSAGIYGPYYAAKFFGIVP